MFSRNALYNLLLPGVIMKEREMRDYFEKKHPDIIFEYDTNKAINMLIDEAIRRDKIREKINEYTIMDYVFSSQKMKKKN